MDIKAKLTEENSRETWQTIADYVGDNEERLAEVMELYFGDDIRLVQRSSQVVSKICNRKVAMVRPYLIEMVNGLSTNPVDAFKRNTLRTFQTSEIPEEVEGELFDHCIEYLKSMDEAIAIKAFGMTVARRICERYPELADEVILPVEILISENYSAGVVNRGKKELKKLLKLRESIS